MDEKILKIQHTLKKELDENRYHHTLGVMYTSASMAMRYDVDVQKALYAGLLHDCAKCIPSDKKIRLCEKYGLPVSSVEKENPSLLHARLGAYLAHEKYGVKDEEIIYAIESHTTGRPGMSMLEKIVYIADYIEPGRRELPNMADGIPTAITQNVKDLLASREVENIFENSDFVLMLNQAQGDRTILAKQLNISPQQMKYVTHTEAGEGLIFYGNVVLPFVDRFPKDTELYRVMTTKPEEVSESGK